MVVTITLNGKKVEALVKPDTLLIDFVRDHGCYSVKRGCETSNCGLCTVFVNDKPVLSCSMLVARVNGCKVDTLEGLQKEAEEFGAFIADQGAEQCGFCNPGMIMNAIALFRENPDPSDEEIKEYLTVEKVDFKIENVSGYSNSAYDSNFLAVTWIENNELNLFTLLLEDY